MSASAAAAPVLLARDLEVVRAGRTLAHVDVLELLAGLPAEHSTSLRNVMPGMVKSVRPSGRLLHVVVAAESAEIAALITRAAAEELGLEVGRSVVAAFKASAVHPIARHERRLS